MRNSRYLQFLRKGLMGALALAMALTVGMSTDVCSLVVRADSAAKVTATSIKIRKEPTTSSEAIGSAALSDNLSIIGKTTGSDGNTWYQVYVDADQKGYVRSDLVSITDGSTPPTLGASNNTSTTGSTATTSTPDETLVEVTAVAPVSASVSGGSPVRIRQNASTSSRIVSTAQSGLAMTVTGTAVGTDGKNWYQVNFISNSTEVNGFVRSDYVTVSGELVPADSTVPQETENPGQTTEPIQTTESPQTKEWDTYYADGTWHLLNSKTGNAYSIDNIFEAVESNRQTLSDVIKKNKTWEIIVIILGFLLVGMAIVICFLVFKIKDMSDAAYMERAEREAARKRVADRPQSSGQRVTHTVGPEKKSARPGGPNGQRPRTNGGNGQGSRPGGGNGQGPRPGGANGQGARPGGPNGQRPRANGGNGQGSRPGGGNGQGSRPNGQNSRPDGANGQRPMRTPEGKPVQQAPVREPLPEREVDAEPTRVMPEISEAELNAAKQSAKQPAKESARRARNFMVEDDEFEFSFLDWDGEDNK